MADNWLDSGALRGEIRAGTHPESQLQVEFQWDLSYDMFYLIPLSVT